MSSLLQLLPYFEAVARLGNFTRAASQLGVTPPAVSQNIQALENQLGVRLFHRTSRSVRLSDEGRLFYQKVSPAMSQIDVAADDVRALGAHPAGLLRITLPQLAASLLVMPHLAEFQRRYPDVQLELFTEDRFSDLVLGSFDAGIRMHAMLQRHDRRADRQRPAPGAGRLARLSGALRRSGHAGRSACSPLPALPFPRQRQTGTLVF